MTRITGAVRAARRSAREETAKEHLRRWVEAAGAQVLVVDPRTERSDLTDAMAGRGIHITWVGSTVDGLVAFGRTDPHAVVVAPDSPGIAPADFVTAIRRHGAAYVIAALTQGRTVEVAPLMRAGASAVVARPYTPQGLWQLLSAAPRPIAEHARVAVGPIELDATAYRVSIEGSRIPDLPLKEFELLRELLLRSPGVVTDEEIRAALWSGMEGGPSGNTIAMHVTRLRARLGTAATVRRIRGRGYALTVG